MPITVKHLKVSTVPDAGDDTLVEPSDWNADHQLTGLGTMAEQNANAVAITGGTISGVTIPASNITGTLGVPNGGTGATTLTGYVKGTGTTAMTAAATIPNTDITGLGTASTKDAGAANGVATLDAGGKVPVSELPAAVLGALSYQGTWDANTNSPTLTSSVGTKGYYYVVSVAGNTNLNGITDWLVGDWAVFNGSVWQKVDNTETVTSVNGQTGAVVLTTTNIAEGTNLYYTDARARGAISAGTGISYNNTTGVVTNAAPDQTVSLTGGTGISTSGTYPNFTITNTSPSLGGDVVGPASATDNAIARFDTTTGKLLQNSVVTVGDTGAVSGVTTLAASTSVTTPIVQATNSAGLSLKNSAGTTQISMGGGGGDNVTIAVATNINGANAQIDISPTGTGHVHIKPTGTGSLEIAPTNVGTINNMTIGATTPRNASVVDLSVTGTLSLDAAQGTAGQVLTSAGTGVTPTWTTPTTGTVTSVAATAGTGISVSGSPITSSGTLTITNTAPDQTVVLTGGTGISTSGTYPSFTVTNTAPDQTVALASGTGISVTGTYPNFTVTNTAPSSGGTVTSVTGTAPVVSSGGNTPAISMAAATGSVNGYLTSTDWTTFNGKAPAVTYTTNYVPFGQGTTTPNQSASFTYTTGTGALRVPAVEASNGLVVNNMTIATSYSIPSGYAASSVGPVVVSSGVTITVPSGSRWVVL